MRAHSQCGKLLPQSYSSSPAHTANGAVLAHKAHLSNWGAHALGGQRLEPSLLEFRHCWWKLADGQSCSSP